MKSMQRDAVACVLSCVWVLFSRQYADGPPLVGKSMQSEASAMSCSVVRNQSNGQYVVCWKVLISVDFKLMFPILLAAVCLFISSQFHQVELHIRCNVFMTFFCI